MAGLSIGDAVGAGFGVIRRRPMSVLAWGVVQLAIAAMTLSVFGSFFIDLALQALSNVQASAGSKVPVAMPMSTDMIQRMMGMQSISMLLNLGGVLVRSVIYCAVIRAVLHPEQGRFAYLRIGSAELFVTILTIAAFFALTLAIIAPMLVIGLIVAGLAAAHAGTAAAIVGILGVIATLVALAYVALRLSLVAPMIVDDGKMHLLDAWALTRRHAGGLFMIALCLFAILIAAEIVIGLLALIVGLGALGSVAGGLPGLRTFFQQPPAAIFSSLTPLLIIGGMVSVPLTGCSFAITGAPWARAYRDLSGPDLAATFS